MSKRALLLKGLDSCFFIVLFLNKVSKKLIICKVSIFYLSNAVDKTTKIVNKKSTTYIVLNDCKFINKAFIVDRFVIFVFGSLYKFLID